MIGGWAICQAIHTMIERQATCGYGSLQLCFLHGNHIWQNGVVPDDKLEGVGVKPYADSIDPGQRARPSSLIRRYTVRYIVAEGPIVQIRAVLL